MNRYRRDWVTSVRAMFVFTVLTGLLYPLCFTALAKLAFPQQTTGSLVTKNGQMVGSELIGQSFSRPQYFWPRPSAVKYDATASGATNLSPNSADFVKLVHERESQGAVHDLRFASASGLDPHISPQAAISQVARVANARHLNADQLKSLELLVQNQVETRQFGFLGQPRVNVLKLNLLVDEHFGK